MTQDCWQLAGAGPENYERYQVPGIFGPLARILLRHIAPQPGQRVLDVACGTGIVARLVAPMVGTTGRVVGVDLNAGMLELAQRLAPTADTGIEWVQADAVRLPFPDGTFDVVLCQQGLQFFPDRAASLREMHRVLAPDGRLGLCVWQAVEHSPCHVAISDALARHVDAATARRIKAPFSLGDAGELRALVADAGFRSVDVQPADVSRRLGPPSESIPGLLAATPIGPDVAKLEAGVREVLVNDVAAALAGYREGDGLTIPQPTHIGLARK